MNQTIETGTPVTLGVPFGNLAMTSLRGEPGEQVLEGDAGKDLAHEPSTAPVADAAKLCRAARRPFQSDEREAAQDEQEGERDDEGRQPRADDDLAVDGAEQSPRTRW